jgi:hypothetical protein
MADGWWNFSWPGRVPYDAFTRQLHEDRMKAKAKAKKPAATAKRNKPAGEDAIALLKADHRKVEGMFDKYEKLKSASDKAKLAHAICKELIIHTELEEQIFYPACLEAGVEEDMMDEAQVEHDGAKVMIIELLGKPGSDDYYDAKVQVLSEYIKHHVKEEEKPGEGVFAKARKAGVDTDTAGSKMAAKKKELVAKYDAESLPPPAFRSLKDSAKANGGAGDRDDEPNVAMDLTPHGEPRPWMKVARAAK